MPNRVIKESIKRSPQIDSLTWFEEVVFYRLIVTADDYGCIDGRPVLIKNELFPTRENVTRKSVEDAITKLVAVGLLFQYEFEGRPYLAFPTWEKHQRIRNKHRKYPAPPDDIRLSSDCCQTSANRLPESESNPNPNQNPNTTARARGDGAFDRFWVEYPKKVGKGQAQKAFSKVSVPVETLIEAVQRQRNSVQWQKDGGQYIPNPATWLNQRRWEDDLDSLNMGGGVTHGGTFPDAGPSIEKLPAASDGWWDI